MAIAPASGIRLNAIRRNVCEQPCETLRSTWWRRRPVRKTDHPVRGMVKTAQAANATTVLLNSTSPTG